MFDGLHLPPSLSLPLALDVLEHDEEFVLFCLLLRHLPGLFDQLGQIIIRWWKVDTVDLFGLGGGILGRQ